jgi:hypothetical protein
MIESRQSLPSEMAVEKMSKIFKTKYWYPKNVELPSAGEIASKEPPKQKRKVVEKPMVYDHHTYEVVDGKLVIYGVVHKVVKLAEYNLGNVRSPLDIVDLPNYESDRRTITVNDLDLE